ncbi:LURP-one-related family protein [Ruminococcus sp. Marseille-P6503]|uniref:LURP-one-related/scramblase family protein n=1 Tax=Ruminococcus sp. Marseille-P6503 TaxID=2364796 RepID=UPI000F53673B|nr:LURP-one-related family protein [Ruminococcus sp. Marseille-P6503]
MKLVFRQRIFSWFDSYDIYDESGNTVFTVKGQLAWGHCFRIYDRTGSEVGMLKEKVLSFLPVFEMYIDGSYAGRIKKQLTFFKPKFTLDYNGWTVDGNWLEWDYSVYSGEDKIMTVSKDIVRLTDTYILDVYNDENALSGLMIALAIDAEKCSGR